MTLAELLRKHATEAENEGGIWFSGAYMNMMATMAESVEAENASLRGAAIGIGDECDRYKAKNEELQDMYRDRVRELGIEVNG